MSQHEQGNIAKKGEATEEGAKVPPYEDRSSSGGQTDEQAARQDKVSEALQGTNAPEGNQTSSPADERPAEDAGPPTDELQEGVATPGKVSGVRRGEDVAGKGSEEAGRTHEGTEADTDRPVGRSDPRDSSGVNPQGPRDDDSPTMPAGDQGG